MTTVSAVVAAVNQTRLAYVWPNTRRWWRRDKPDILGVMQDASGRLVAIDLVRKKRPLDVSGFLVMVIDLKGVAFIARTAEHAVECINIAVGGKP